ncbi:MAG: methylenetetrahydrofolate reductase [NAD(P)H] [Prevotellaceae bacterium]|nr:methylenetetrahydrofolate reductase [NAD(P)H] [Prevotellaceae bacterium]
MRIIDLITDTERPAFSFEVLPPLKGTGIGSLRRTIDSLREFGPKYINITTHRSEYVYKDLGEGIMQRLRIRRRPGTVAVAAAIQREYGIPVVPHILCSGFNREETEYVLLDLQFLGIENILLLRGDKANEDKVFMPAAPDGYSHTTELQWQVNEFNEGRFVDGSPIKEPGAPFCYGVACYPEKHEEALNAETDLMYFKRKVELGASYGVTQLFYDNAAYFHFVDRARKAGIEVPIVPGIKPLSKLSQLQTVPKTFHCNLPEPLAAEAMKCKTDEEAKQLGIEWTTHQCKELIAAGVPSIHFYTVSAVDSIREIARRIY